MENVISANIDNNLLSKQERLLRFFLALTAVVIFFAIYFWDPITHPLTVCKFHELTGVSCPTCGMSRSVQAAAHLRFVESIRFHGAGWVVLAGLVFLFFRTMTEAVQGKKLHIIISARQKKLIFWGIISLWILSWFINIARDLNLLIW
ncbi:hypothetical protein B6D60_04070 [candidate division KSB1 bacterium 4484_87]|nr:MAG: hypothetical protein B6D60_04070 [candidate division KSB1 bacterium 4484_87]